MLMYIDGLSIYKYVGKGVKWVEVILFGVRFKYGIYRVSYGVIIWQD